MSAERGGNPFRCCRWDTVFFSLGGKKCKMNASAAHATCAANEFVLNTVKTRVFLLVSADASCW